MIVRKHSITILCVSETWLNDTITDNDVLIDGFTIVRKDRCNKTGGGVAIYIDNHIVFKRRDDLITDLSLECIWIQVTTVSHSILICCVYRPPDSDTLIYNHIIDTIENACRGYSCHYFR